jgi:hypothetical protein
MPHILPSATVFRKGIWDNFWWDESLTTADDTDAFLRISPRTAFLFVPDIFIRRIHTAGSLIYQPQRNLSLNAAYIFERFYYKLGGAQFVSRRKAKKQINRLYQRCARKHYNSGYRAAAIKLYKKAIQYYPYDQHYCRDLLKTFLMSKKDDKMPNWQMPQPLPPYITVNGKEMPSSL